MRFVWTMAVRFLLEGRHQSALIVVGASVGVAVMVFLTALIDGVQKNLIDKTLGATAHVSLGEDDREARPLMAETGRMAVMRTLQPVAQRLSSISNWPAQRMRVSELSGVEAVAPLLSGPGIAVKGQGRESVVLNGVDTEAYNRVIPVSSRMASGRFRLSGNDVVVGAELARSLGISLGDKVRIAGIGDRSAVLSVAGVFELENKEADSRWVFVSLASAQALLDLAGGVSHLLVRVGDVFSAEELARRAAWRTGLFAESWMKRNEELLSALKSQDSSSATIQFFVVLAVALGIASVLFVSVVQKSKEIGILKAMGAKSATVVKVFVAEGLLVGFLGSVVGCALGAGLAVAFRDLSSEPGGAPLLPITLDWPLFVQAALVALASSGFAGVFPARRASRLDPVEVIRNG